MNSAGIRSAIDYDIYGAFRLTTVTSIIINGIPADKVPSFEQVKRTIQFIRTRSTRSDPDPWDNIGAVRRSQPLSIAVAIYATTLRYCISDYNARRATVLRCTRTHTHTHTHFVIVIG